jgi:hyperosmotically inducible periplasmic protein
MKTKSLLAALMMLSGGLMAGCATTRADAKVERGETVGEFLDDASVTTQVNALIVADKDARFLKIDVTTTQGDVVLQGFVNNKDTQDRLVTQIQGVRGVKSVRSLLRIEEKQSQLVP